MFINFLKTKPCSFAQKKIGKALYFQAFVGESNTYIEDFHYIPQGFGADILESGYAVTEVTAVKNM